jgi:RNA polymerase sigma-19 factor, ECF subfamily
VEQSVAASVDMKPDGKAASLARSAFSEYHAALHEFLTKRLRSAQDASDAMQEVFLRLLRLERGDLVRNPQAYLYGIASHVIREFRVRARRERHLRDLKAIELRAQQARPLAPDEAADNLGTENQLEQALAKLSPAELRILVYDRCDGLSHEEIARKMGLSAHTVKKYFFRALALLRTQLDQDEGT